MKTSILALALVLGLAACGSEEPVAEETTPAPTIPPSQSVSCTDPLGQGLTEFPARGYLTCVIEATAATQGYSLESRLNGEPYTTMKVDMDPFWVDISYHDGTELIANLGDSWAKVDGQWVEGDANSENYVIAQATQVAQTYHASLNPQLALVSTPEDLMYTVEGEETIDGVTYVIVSGTTEDSTGSSTLRQWVTRDYRQLKSESTTVSSDGNEMTLVNEFTSWDEPQNIEAPL